MAYFDESGNRMVTCCDLERFRNELDVDLSEIEKTFELKTLPRDRYLRNLRIVELLGTKAYKEFRASLWQETSYKKLMDKKDTKVEALKKPLKGLKAFKDAANAKEL